MMEENVMYYNIADDISVIHSTTDYDEIIQVWEEIKSGVYQEEFPDCRLQGDVRLTAVLDIM